MIWEDYGKVRENLDEYVEKVAQDDEEVILARRGKEPDVILMSRNQYTIMSVQLKELRRVKKVLDALEEYTSYRKEVREHMAKQPPASKRIGAGLGLFDIPDDFFDDDFEPDEEPPKDQTVSVKKDQAVSKKDQPVSGKAEALRVAV